jgi:soluble P-type ATPase
MARDGIVVEIAGQAPLHLREAVFDFNGTLAVGGALAPGVGPRVRELGRVFEIHVVSADTFGTARTALRGLPLELHHAETGAEKKRFVLARQAQGVVVIGNGRNDVAMMSVATLGIAVLGAEGLSPTLLPHAAVVVRDVLDAFDLLTNPRRLCATLRT